MRVSIFLIVAILLSAYVAMLPMLPCRRTLTRP